MWCSLSIVDSVLCQEIFLPWHILPPLGLAKGYLLKFLCVYIYWRWCGLQETSMCDNFFQNLNTQRC